MALALEEKVVFEENGEDSGPGVVNVNLNF